MRDPRTFRQGFTLVEVLAALAVMAIVIPVVMQGLQIANRAGVVAQRKIAASRIAERVMNESMVTGKLRSGGLNGVIREGPLEFRWLIRSEGWLVNTLRLVTVQVTFPTQGRDYDVQLSTLIDPSL